MNRVTISVPTQLLKEFDEVVSKEVLATSRNSLMLVAMDAMVQKAKAKEKKKKGE